MDELVIVNYCSPDCEPLKSITRLPEERAYAEAKALSDRHQGTAFIRFADFANYYPRRIRSETWLYDEFVAMGGEPETEHPLYFVLDKSDYLHKWFGGGAVSVLPLDGIRREHISFTFGDSMSKFDRPERRPPFMLERLHECIRQHGGVQEFLLSIQEQYNYIEVQLWSDDYLDKIKRCPDGRPVCTEY